MWSGRAAIEFLQSYRTWLGTLTLHPQERFRVTASARARLAGQGVDFDTLPAAEQFTELLAELWPHVRNFLKRLRRGGGARAPMRVRYLVACEPHKDGFPHFHILLHEQRLHAGVGRRELEAEWRDAQSGVKLGHAGFKLVRDAGGARYAAKYLGKYETDRVKASLHYGAREGVPINVVVGLGGGLAVAAAGLAEDGGAAAQSSETGGAEPEVPDPPPRF